MKTKLTLFILMILNFGLFSQVEYEVTPNGLRDKSNIGNDFLVIESPTKVASELYQNSIRYINENYKNPEKVIKGKTENEYLRFETYVPRFTKIRNGGIEINMYMKYTIELRFKDGKVRFEITSLTISNEHNINVEYQGSKWKCYPIYNQKNGELRLPETKKEIEDYFNDKIVEITNFLMDKEMVQDDW